MSNKKNIIMVLALSVILIATVGSASAWLFGDDSSSESTGEKISVVHNDSTFHFYPIDSLPNDDGYEYAIVVDGSPYYLSDSLATKLHDSNISHSFSKFYDLEILYDYGNSGPDYVGFMGAYPFVIFDMDKDTSHVGEADFECDADFSFEYKVGTVGINDEAKIVTKLYNSQGTEL